jgi:TonB family protein
MGFLLLMGLARPTVAQQTYKAAELTSAGDAYAPYQVVIDGLYVLDVSLDEEGRVQGIKALRDPGAMPGAAETSVRSWKFQPASKEGKPVASRMTVSFVYCPPNCGGAGAIPPQSFSPALAPDGSDSSGRGDFVSAGVLSCAYPEYRVNSVAQGSVVVQITVDRAGSVKGIEFLHEMEGFNKLAMDALKKWRFQAATLHGKPITSKTVIAFIFQTPASN